MKCIILLLLSVIALLFCAGVQGAGDKSACTQPREVGPCRKADLMYYYDVEAKQCKDFFYGGCQGNDNRFVTKEECEKTCL